MNNLNLELVPTEKILNLIKKRAKQSYIVGYKAESKISDKKLIDKAHLRLTELDLDMIVANDLKDVSPNDNQIIIIHPTKKYRKGNKRQTRGHFPCHHHPPGKGPSPYRRCTWCGEDDLGARVGHVHSFLLSENPVYQRSSPF